MTFELRVDTERWRSGLRTLTDQTPGIVPVREVHRERIMIVSFALRCRCGRNFRHLMAKLAVNCPNLRLFCRFSMETV